MTALREHLAALRSSMQRTEHWDTLGEERVQGGKTGYPPGMLQDDCRPLSRWFASKPDARRHAREAAAQAKEQRRPPVNEEAIDRADAGAWFVAIVLVACVSALLIVHFVRS